MNHYAGIDVSLECSSVCVVDASGKIARRGRMREGSFAVFGWCPDSEVYVQQNRNHARHGACRGLTSP
jgi:hypothetical protein